MTERALAPWYRQSRPQWEAAVSGWLTATGQRLGLGQVEAVSTVKERPWSLVRQVIFTHGSTHFRACGAGGSFEPGLLLFLEQQGIPFVPKVLAVGPSQKSESRQITDFSGPDHDWFLLADAGVPFREGLSTAEQLGIMAPVLALNCAHMFQGAPEEVLNRWRPMIFERLAGWAGSDPVN